MDDPCIRNSNNKQIFNKTVFFIIYFVIFIKNQRRPWMSAIVILTSKSGSSDNERICFLIVSLTDALSHRLAISLSTFTQTYLMFGTGSFEAEIINERDLSRNVYPWIDMQTYLRE